MEQRRKLERGEKTTLRVRCTCAGLHGVSCTRLQRWRATRIKRPEGTPLAASQQGGGAATRAEASRNVRIHNHRAATFRRSLFLLPPPQIKGRGVANTPAWNISVHRATAVDELPAAKVLSQKADEHTNGGQRGWLEKVFASFFFLLTCCCTGLVTSPAPCLSASAT